MIATNYVRLINTKHERIIEYVWIWPDTDLGGVNAAARRFIARYDLGMGNPRVCVWRRLPAPCDWIPEIGHSVESWTYGNGAVRLPIYSLVLDDPWTLP